MISNENVFFLILHYGDPKVTINCIESIKKMYAGDNVGIVVVDNASKNGSYEKLTNRYSKQNKIIILQILEARGFSFGNNFGYKYIINHFEPKMIIVCNNDIVFTQNDFIKKLLQTYEQTKFYVAGPDIYNINSRLHQNPLHKKLCELDEIERRINSLKKEIKYLWFYAPIDRFHSMMTKCKVYQQLRKIRHNNLEERYSENVCLYGACIIISEKYIENENSLFSPETFFYCEEEILSYKCVHNGWKLAYFPSLKVEHRESCATRGKFSDYKIRREFSLKNTLDSLNIYRKYVLSLKNSVQEKR